RKMAALDGSHPATFRIAESGFIPLLQQPTRGATSSTPIRVLGTIGFALHQARRGLVSGQVDSTVRLHAAHQALRLVELQQAHPVEDAVWIHAVVMDEGRTVALPLAVTRQAHLFTARQRLAQFRT